MIEEPGEDERPPLWAVDNDDNGEFNENRVELAALELDYQEVSLEGFDDDEI